MFIEDRGAERSGVLSTPYSMAFLHLESRSSSSRSGGGMECGVAAPGGFSRPHPSHPQHPALSPTERSPAKAGLHVNFSDKGEVKERREKFLTAKYGSHQMALIRKRLAVEMWLYDELQKLYEVPSEAAAGGGAGAATGAGASTEVEVDIDELLDMDSDDIRRRHLTTLLAEAKKPQKDVHKFINELLEKAKTL
ncbi:phosphatase 1 regulatory subunit 14B isoform 1 [Danaus plexippus plexippus]|uniref:Phosphatase 1 regulatory subunit 14B isoform 1 n=1 Tax=Danaus plexippus plexippus TaxID=278856 RepID=A0A212F6B0_DANPL|nr:phosphatase 1 regulatory subunit 14B isoform 1 [Danaus plexippus plexippus]